MNTMSSTPVIVPVSPAVLLCFLPSATTQDALRERAFMSAMALDLQQRLPGSVRILKVDESIHPEVVKSFHLTQLPAFVLVQQGIERWRQEGIRRFDELALLPGLLSTLPKE
ncbi:thioredoxin family protein [Fibrella aquatica]|uniref:thioredoxin family protein n=1 Tax=Fibrella aquatica TaxID=3242487 RepID=UPI00352190AD